MVENDNNNNEQNLAIQENNQVIQILPVQPLQIQNLDEKHVNQNQQQNDNYQQRELEEKNNFGTDQNDKEPGIQQNNNNNQQPKQLQQNDNYNISQQNPQQDIQINDQTYIEQQHEQQQIIQQPIYQQQDDQIIQKQQEQQIKKQLGIQQNIGINQEQQIPLLVQQVDQQEMEDITNHEVIQKKEQQQPEEQEQVQLQIKKNQLNEKENNLQNDNFNQQMIKRQEQEEEQQQNIQQPIYQQQDDQIIQKQQEQQIKKQLGIQMNIGINQEQQIPLLVQQFDQQKIEDIANHEVIQKKEQQQPEEQEQVQLQIQKNQLNEKENNLQNGNFNQQMIKRQEQEEEARLIIKQKEKLQKQNEEQKQQSQSQNLKFIGEFLKTNYYSEIEDQIKENEDYIYQDESGKKKYLVQKISFNHHTSKIEDLKKLLNQMISQPYSNIQNIIDYTFFNIDNHNQFALVVKELIPITQLNFSKLSDTSLFFFQDLFVQTRQILQDYQFFLKAFDHKIDYMKEIFYQIQEENYIFKLNIANILEKIFKSDLQKNYHLIFDCTQLQIITQQIPYQEFSRFIKILNFQVKSQIEEYNQQNKNINQQLLQKQQFFQFSQLEGGQYSIEKVMSIDVTQNISTSISQILIPESHFFQNFLSKINDEKWYLSEFNDTLKFVKEQQKEYKSMLFFNKIYFEKLFLFNEVQQISDKVQTFKAQIANFLKFSTDIIDEDNFYKNSPQCDYCCRFQHQIFYERQLFFQINFSDEDDSLLQCLDCYEQDLYIQEQQQLQNQIYEFSKKFQNLQIDNQQIQQQINDLLQEKNQIIEKHKQIFKEEKQLQITQGQQKQTAEINNQNHQLVVLKQKNQNLLNNMTIFKRIESKLENYYLLKDIQRLINQAILKKIQFIDQQLKKAIVNRGFSHNAIQQQNN